MGNLTDQLKAEFKQLPLLLCKLSGGLAAVIGFMAAVVIMTRRSNASLGDVLLPLLLAIAGIVVFLLSNRRLAGYPAIAADETPPAGKKRTSLLSWMLLLLFAGIFLACVHFLTR